MRLVFYQLPGLINLDTLIWGDTDGTSQPARHFSDKSWLLSPGITKASRLNYPWRDPRKSIIIRASLWSSLRQKLSSKNHHFTRLRGHVCKARTIPFLERAKNGPQTPLWKRIAKAYLWNEARVPRLTLSNGVFLPGPGVVKAFPQDQPSSSHGWD